MTTGRIPSVDGGIQPTIIDAAGDLIYGASNDTPARLAIGTAGQVLTVNSGATAPEWGTPAAGGGMTLLSTTNLSGSTVDLSSISQDYVDLGLHIYNVRPSADAYFLINFRNSTTDQAKYYGVVYLAGNAGTVTNTTNPIYLDASGSSPSQINAGANENGFYLIIRNYKETHKRAFTYTGAWEDADATFRSSIINGFISGTSAINSITIALDGGKTFSAGTVKLYGIA